MNEWINSLKGKLTPKNGSKILTTPQKVTKRDIFQKDSFGHQSYREKKKKKSLNSTAFLPMKCFIPFYFALCPKISWQVTVSLDSLHIR